VTATASDWIHEVGRLLGERGYVPARSSIGSALSMTRRGHSFGPFLPFTDYVFVHECTIGTSAAEFARLHEEARALAGSDFPLPKALRYHIPNTVSVGVSSTGFSAETIAFAEQSTLRNPLVGGEKDSKYLFDIMNRKLYSQGHERTPARYGATVVSPVNPTNRTYELMVDIFRQLATA
jgi:hypothetical protein